MKRGSQTDKDITFSIFEGVFADYGTATPLLAVTLTPADFTNQYLDVYFATTPIDLTYGHTYTGVLATDAGTSGAYQFFIKEKTGLPAFAIPQYGDLKIVKFNDFNENGIFDEGSDEYLPGWEFLVEGGNYSNIVVTGPDGSVTIQGLPPMQFTITETVQSGWTVTTDNPQYATVIPDSLVTVYFGNAEEGGGDNPVAEPQALALMALGILGIRRRRS